MEDNVQKCLAEIKVYLKKGFNAEEMRETLSERYTEEEIKKASDISFKEVLSALVKKKITKTSEIERKIANISKEIAALSKEVNDAKINSPERLQLLEEYFRLNENAASLLKSLFEK